MSYCDPAWVSDYSFRRAVNRRLAVERSPSRDLWQALPVESTLMLWGGVLNGELDLEPAFAIEARPRLPERGGPYRLEGLGPDGELRFGFDFHPDARSTTGGARISTSTCPTTRPRTVCWRAWSCRGRRGSSRLGRPARARWRSSSTGIPDRCARSSAAGRARPRLPAAIGPRILVSDGLPWTVR